VAVARSLRNAGVLNSQVKRQYFEFSLSALYFSLKFKVGSPAAMVQEAFLKIYARGVVSYFYFPHAPRARALKIRQTNSAILKVPDGAWIR
jgi:hypothetical protein